MIRKAVNADNGPIAATYDELLRYEQQHENHSNWQLGVYPTAAVPESRIPEGSMYVLEENGEICASMIINHEQADEYAGVDWAYRADGEQVLVIHTLCIPPSKASRGYGTQMLHFAKEYAAEHGCRVIRIDTYAHNEPAKSLYRKSGFRIAGYGIALLQGLIKEELVFLEYRME